MSSESIVESTAEPTASRDPLESSHVRIGNVRLPAPARAINSRSKLIAASLGGLLAIALVISVFLNQRDKKAQEERNALYEARTELAQETEASKLTPYQKADVDQVFSKALAQLKKVASDAKGTLVGFQAALQIGNLYSDHGVPAQALSWYETAASQAPTPLERAAALSAWAGAQESAGQCQQAIATWEKALALQTGNLRSDTLLSIARCQATLKDISQAKATYERVSKEFPNTAAAKIAELAHDRLP